MALERPIWQQSGTYSARLDRQLIAALSTGGVVAPHEGAFAVTERGAGANFSVDVAPGRAVVPGTSQANQGSYVCVSTATENIEVPPAPGANARLDLVVLKVRDSQIAGSDDDFMIELIEGVAAPDPVAPAVPDDGLPLAQILVESVDVSVTDGMITDLRLPVRPPGVPYMATMLHYRPETPDNWDTEGSETMTPVDSSEIAFVAPTPGVLVRASAMSSYPSAGSLLLYYWALMDGDDQVIPGTTVLLGSMETGNIRRRAAEFFLSGLTPGVPYTVKLAHEVSNAGPARIVIEPQSPLHIEVWAVPEPA